MLSQVAGCFDGSICETSHLPESNEDVLLHCDNQAAMKVLYKMVLKCAEYVGSYQLRIDSTAEVESIEINITSIAIIGYIER
jgi:hypothetical protein